METNIMTFKSEADFEEALIRVLQQNAWEKEVIKYPTEQDLIRNWADILYDNNRSIDRLGDNPLTDGEMQQIIEQIRELPRWKRPRKIFLFLCRMLWNALKPGRNGSIKQLRFPVKKMLFYPAMLYGYQKPSAIL